MDTTRYTVELSETETGYRWELVLDGTEMVDSGSAANKDAALAAGNRAAESAER